MWLRVGIYAVVLVFGTTGAARANWQVCNSTAEDAWVAIAYDQGDGSMVSRGWWGVRACGGCKTVHSGDFSVTGAFLYAEGKNGDEWTGDNLFCVSYKGDHGFTIVGGGRCEARGFTTKDFMLVHVKKGGTHTTRLTGGASKAHCID